MLLLSRIIRGVGGEKFVLRKQRLRQLQPVFFVQLLYWEIYKSANDCKCFLFINKTDDDFERNEEIKSDNIGRDLLKRNSFLFFHRNLFAHLEKSPPL